MTAPADLYADDDSDPTVALHETACAGCGFEPEVVTYYRRNFDKVRVGYECTCGAIVINGVVMGFSRP